LVASDKERLDVQREMGLYFATFREERSKGEPGSHLVSMMAHDEATKNLNTGDLISNFALLIVGGNDTTRNTMTGSLPGTVQ
jgi:cytochrome P450